MNMWQCIKCGQNNDDRVNICPHCGAARSAGRFASTQGMQNTSVSSVSAPYTPDLEHAKDGKLFRFIGLILTILLPAIVLVLAIVKHDAFLSSLYEWLLGSDAADSVPFWCHAFYVILSFAALLVAALPGLWTLCLGKALRRLHRMEELL